MKQIKGKYSNPRQIIHVSFNRFKKKQFSLDRPCHIKHSQSSTKIRLVKFVNKNHMCLHNMKVGNFRSSTFSLYKLISMIYSL